MVVEMRLIKRFKKIFELRPRKEYEEEVKIECDRCEISSGKRNKLYVRFWK
jgi:hypothetical protein